jgi:hypothetical protein
VHLEFWAKLSLERQCAPTRVGIFGSHFKFF